MGDDKKQYDFITETIKEKPKKKAFWKRALATIILGIIFGLAACVAFVFCEPYISAYFQKDTTKLVTLSEDDVLVEEASVSIEKADNKEAKKTEEKEKTSEEASKKGSEDAIKVDESEAAEEEIVSNNSENKDPEENEEMQEVKLSEDEEIITDAEENPDEDRVDDIENSDENSEITSNTDDGLETEGHIITKITEKGLGISDYKQLYKELNEVAANAYKSLATVTGVYSDIDWFSNTYESSNQTTGVIIADNGKELLIVAQVKAVADADSIEVTFCDDSILSGKIKKSDPNTGLAIIGVDLTDISPETMEEIEMAKLGTSKLPSIVGSPVIAIGNPAGINGAMAVGQITANNYGKELIDSNVHFITTDIYGSVNASGVLIDLEGKVLGIIYQDVTVTDVRNLIKAYGISDLKPKIEKISNGQDFAYLGVIGTDVTQEANEQLGVPLGAYIKEVEIDSPAMTEGLRSGDVIVKMGTTDINTFDNFKEVMYKSQPGDLLMITVKRLGLDDYVDVSYEVTLKTLEEKNN